MPPRSPRGRQSVVPQPLALTADDEEALRQVQLELLAEFDRVCAVADLEYFALYGTALGAVRHGGFIPWDDDLDLGMLRSNYDRLTQIIDDELADGYTFQTVDTDPHYGCMFGKLRKDDTRCVDRISYGSDQHGGIFIDVFPLDAKASKPVARFEQRLMRYVGFRLLYLKAGYLFMVGTSVASRIVQAVARTVIRVIPRRFVIALTKRHARLGGDSPAQYVSLFGAFGYEHDTVDASWIHPLDVVPFEDVTIPVFVNADAYLTKIYGNYLQPPPPDQRVGHHEFVELDFGKSDQ